MSCRGTKRCWKDHLLSGEKYRFRIASLPDIVQRFLGRGHEATAEIPSSELPKATVNSVTVYGQPKYLVLLDTDITTAADGLTSLQVAIHALQKFLRSVSIVESNGSDIFLIFRLAVM